MHIIVWSIDDFESCETSQSPVKYTFRFLNKHFIFKNNKKRAVLTNQIGELHKEVLDWQMELSQFISLGKRISAESDASQSRSILDNCDLADKRWKNIVKDITIKMNENSINNNEAKEMGQNLNVAVGWAEDTLTLITKQVNVTDVAQLEAIISQLEKAQAEAIKQRMVLDEFAAQVGVNNATYQQSRGKIERIIQMLPKRLGFLVERKNKIERLTKDVEQCQEFVDNMNEKRSKSISPQDSVKIRLNVSDKEYEINKLFNDFLSLEREVNGAGLNIETSVERQLKSLKESWYTLHSDVRKISNNLNGNGETSPSRRVPVEVEVEAEAASPVESLPSLGSPSSCSTSRDMIASPSTPSHSEPEEASAGAGQDNAQNSLIAKCKQVVGWLNNIGKRMTFTLRP